PYQKTICSHDDESCQSRFGSQSRGLAVSRRDIAEPRMVVITRQGWYTRSARQLCSAFTSPSGTHGRLCYHPGVVLEPLPTKKPYVHMMTNPVRAGLVADAEDWS